jgi:hypothetical protein
LPGVKREEDFCPAASMDRLHQLARPGVQPSSKYKRKASSADAEERNPDHVKVGQRQPAPVPPCSLPPTAMNDIWTAEPHSDARACRDG